MSHPTIAVIGGDQRQYYAACFLSAAGFPVVCLHTEGSPCGSSDSCKNLPAAASLEQALAEADAVLLPMPLSKDKLHLNDRCAPNDAPVTLDALFAALHPGQILFGTGFPDTVLPLVQKKELTILNYTAQPDFLCINSRLTAEGLLAELISNTPFALRDSRILLLGYGNCGEAIGRLLLPLSRKIYVLERETQKLCTLTDCGFFPVTLDTIPDVLPHCDIIINTIPDAVLKEKDLEILPKECRVFDIASAPFGFPKDMTSRYDVPYYRLPGLPGKFSPQSAGILIGSMIERMMLHEL